MERSATAFTAADRIGQLAVQINDIDDSRRMLEEHRRLRELAPRLGSAGARLVTLWAGRVGTRPRARGVGVPARRRPELLPYDLAGTLVHAGRLHAAGLLTDDELHDAETRLAAITVDDLEAVRRGRALRDRAAARRRRAQDPRRPLAQRPGRDRVPALRRRRVRRGRRGARRLRERDPRPRRRGGRHGDAGLHAPAARDPGHGRAPPARVGRDAGARPRALRVRRRRRPHRRRSAQARSRARRCRCRRRSTRCATRSTPSPTATSRSTTSTPPPCCSRTSRGSARSSCSGRRRSSRSRGSARTPRRGRR